MRRAVQTKAFMILGACAAAQAGLPLAALKLPAAGKRDRLAAETEWLDDANKAAAENDSAHLVRESMWMEYERRLRDDATYTVNDVAEWLGELIDKHLRRFPVSIGRSSVYRDSVTIHAKERVIALAGEKTKAFLAALGDAEETDVLRGGRLVAAQMIFDALTNLSAEGITDLTNTQIINMINTLGYLSKTHAETGLIDQKLAALRQAAKAAVASASAASKDNKLTRENVYEIIDDIMRGDAA